MGGLLWTGLGLIFLLRNFGIGPDFWTIAGRYWPILLILLGMGKVIDYYRQKEGVSLRAGEVIGILFLLLIGSFVTKVSNSRIREYFRDGINIDFGDSGRVPIGEFLGNSYTFNQEATYPITTPMPIRIDNSYGNVVVAPGSDREIRVRLAKKVYQDEEARAKQIANEIQLEGGTDAGAFVVKTNREALSSKDYRFRTEMEILVPKKVQLQVRTAYGEVRVTNVEGKLDLSTTHKPLELRDCTGQALVSNRYADSRLVNHTGNLQVDVRGRLYLETIKGEVNVRDEYSPVEIKSVDGKVTVSNAESSVSVEDVSKPVVIEARGSTVTVRNLKDNLKVTNSHKRVQVSDVAANVSLDTRYCNVSLKNIKGNAEILSKSDRITLDDLGGTLKVQGEGSSVRANTVAGPIDIATTLKDVIVNDFSGSCKITNEFADVTLSTRTPLKGDITVKNRNGDIELFLPENSSFLIEGTARNGRAESDFAGVSPVEATGDTGMLRGKVSGGGPKIVLETEYSKIRLRKRESESAKSSGN